MPGGTLVAIAAAAIGGQRIATAGRRCPLATITLLAAQTDFSEPGELGLFIDESQVAYLREIMREKGYLTGGQMAGSFQFLHSRDLVWTRRMREYLMGERERPSDLMAWNTDTTRMPARMHNEYLTALYLHNALATGSYRIGGRRGHVVSLADLRQPMFVVGTSRDHVSPWHSVYKLHLLTGAEITFALASGGHNAGIVSDRTRATQLPDRDPPRAGPVDRARRLRARRATSRRLVVAGLAGVARGALDGAQGAAALPRGAALGDAPGEYVLKCYDSSRRSAIGAARPCAGCSNARPCRDAARAALGQAAAWRPVGPPVRLRARRTRGAAAATARPCRRAEREPGGCHPASQRRQRGRREERWRGRCTCGTATAIRSTCCSVRSPRCRA